VTQPSTEHGPSLNLLYLLNLIYFTNVLLVLGKAKTGHGLKCVDMGISSYLDLLAMFLLIESEALLAFFAARTSS